MTQKQKDFEESKKHILSIIEEIRKENKEPELMIFIRSVSRSGMSRKMIVMLDNINITWDIQSLLEQSHNTNYVNVGGCGMDMTFWLADNITYHLFGNDKPNWLTGNGGGCLKWRSLY